MVMSLNMLFLTKTCYAITAFCVDNHIKLYESSQLIKSPCLEMIPAPTWREGLVLGPHSAPEGRSGPSSLQSGKGEARHH